MDKKTYIGIVECALEGMFEYAIENEEYNLQIDIIHYYINEIKAKGIITESEFLALCTKLNIPINPIFHLMKHYNKFPISSGNGS